MTGQQGDDEEARRLIESAGMPQPASEALGRVDASWMTWLATRLVVQHLAAPQGDTSVVRDGVLDIVRRRLTIMDDEIRAVLFRGAPAAPNPPGTDIIHEEDLARWQARRALYVQRHGSPPPDDPRA